MSSCFAITSSLIRSAYFDVPRSKFVRTSSPFWSKTRAPIFGRSLNCPHLNCLKDDRAHSSEVWDFVSWWQHDFWPLSRRSCPGILQWRGFLLLRTTRTPFDQAEEYKHLHDYFGRIVGIDTARIEAYRWRDKRVLHPPVWLDNWGVEVFVASYLWLVLTIGMRWRWLGKVGCCPLLCQGIKICRILVEWSVWLCCVAKVQSIPVLRIASWRHIELVCLDKVSAVVCRRCVGIVSRLSSCSLALTNALVVCCSPSPMWSRCIVFLSNHRWVCNVPCWVCFLDAGHVPCQCISPQSHPRPMWIALAVCRVSRDRVPICFVCLFKSFSRSSFASSRWKICGEDDGTHGARVL